MSRWWCRLTRKLTGARHPGFELLLAWQEHTAREELPEWVGTHLRGCESCGRQAESIRLVLERSSSVLGQADAFAGVEHGVARLLSVLRNEAVVEAVRERLQRGRDLHLAAGLAAYFGPYPMSLLERSVAGGPHFRTEIKRLAEGFVGKRAAEALICRSEPDRELAGDGG